MKPRWLEFEVDPHPEGGITLQQTAVFDPMGLGGNLYWFGLSLQDKDIK